MNGVLTGEADAPRVSELQALDDRLENLTATAERHLARLQEVITRVFGDDRPEIGPIAETGVSGEVGMLHARVSRLDAVLESQGGLLSRLETL